jgi:glycosyltransferase involved in cell wall biosynthesis
MASPAVSIVIPVFKVTPYIAETLDSLRAQTYRDFEAILVNDGCPDTENLERVLEPYRDEIVYLKSGKWASISGSRNNGIEAARGRYVAFLDGDDKWAPDYLADQIGILEANPEIDLVAPNALMFGMPEWEGKPLTDPAKPSGLVSMKELITRETTLFVGVTARRDSLVRAGLFDPNVKGGEDWDVWMRVVRTGGTIFYNSHPVGRYRLRPGSMSMDKLDLLNNGLTVCRKHLALPDLLESERALFEATARQYQANIHLVKGKQALYSGSRKEAIQLLSQANAVLKNPRVQFAITAMKIAPALLRFYVRSRYPTEYAYLH